MLGPNREFAFSQQPFGQGCSLGILTYHSLSRGMQSPHEGEHGKKSTWHRTNWPMGQVPSWPAAVDLVRLVISISMNQGWV